jgi:prefoldin subunit 5
MHEKCHSQIDHLQARIAALEAKNKEYLDKIANPVDEGRVEMIRATKMARKSVGFMEEVEVMEKLVDETLDDLAQKDQTISYLRTELESKIEEINKNSLQIDDLGVRLSAAELMASQASELATEY